MIELEKSQLEAIYAILDKVQLNKIFDAEIRKSILKLVLAVSKELDSMRRDIEQMKTKYFSEFSKEDKQAFQNGVFEVEKLVRANELEEAKVKDIETSEKYPELTKAYLALNNDLAELQKEKISLNIEKFSLDSFLDAMVGQPINITMKELNLLNSIFNNDSEN